MASGAKSMQSDQSKSSISSRHKGKKNKRLSKRIRSIEKTLSLFELNSDDEVLHGNYYNIPGNDNDFVESALIALLNDELKSLQEDIVAFVGKHYKQTEFKFYELQKDIGNLKVQFLTLLELDKKEPQHRDESFAYLLTLVKEELEILKLDVNAANFESLKRVEKLHIEEKIEIQNLKLMLDNERERNRLLEVRIEKLEKMSFTNSRVDKNVISKSHDDRKWSKNKKKESPNDEKRRISKQQEQIGTKQPNENIDIHQPVKTKKNKSTNIEKKRISNQQEQMETKERNENIDIHQPDETTYPNVNEQNVGYLEKARQYLMALQVDNSTDLIGGTASGSRNKKENFINGCDMLKQPTLTDAPIEWVIRKQNATSVVVVQHGGTYYTQNPGYRVQFRAQIDRLHGDIYFSVRVLKGIFDDHLTWPFCEKFQVRLSDKTTKGKSVNQSAWSMPDRSQWKQQIRKSIGRKDRVYTEWVGPFNISQFIDREKVIFDISLA